MEKFTKLKPKENKSPKENVLFDNKYIKVIDFENWSIISEKNLVVCIPYFIETNQFLIRQEYIPTFKYVEGQEYYATVLSGGIELGEEPQTALLRELEEEAGIVLNEDYDLEKLKPLFINKGHVNKYFPYILPLSEKDYSEVIAKGDGSEAEKLSKSVKVDVKYIDSINTADLITDYMLLKFKEYLNVFI